MKKILIVAILITSLFGCKKAKKGENGISNIDKALLTFPLKDETCTTGDIVSVTESKILFKWNAVKNADHYELTVKDLNKGTLISRITAGMELEFTLLRNTPYSWFVKSVSLNGNVTAESETWKFFNAGAGTLAYAPFPAEAIAPTSDQNMSSVSGKVTLDWVAMDVDDDIKDYDVYFGATKTVTLLKSNVKESVLEQVSIQTNRTYYWKINTRDMKGNISESDLFRFTTTN